MTTDLTTGTWALDAAHSAASFTVRHAGISRVRGQFDSIDGSMVVGDGKDDVKYTATLQVDSINTGNADRDNHLKSGDFFDAEKNPTITFTSTEVKGDKLAGELTIMGITKPVELDYEFGGVVTDPFGTKRAGVAAETTISRKEFGLTWNAALEAGGVMVSDNVRITIEAEFVAPTA
ncbi:YceI family protein [Helcobacillus massiliensis]|uniref:YceI family protein n=1 Tax=Helcobacillus massiliensis TaxID=521392 RepID=UPI0021A948C4|nr:YceI family protein [Helcobacillus massiliensis]MCT1558360.1 YceI family protein [Helcobacillus massiliensis]MCT2036586.1 YceI family protein [Helcobacillus massiliensis]MCT2332311.1 YceI family protein [Helcobacillus massiliensis]